jgi:hypothetical protein
MSEMQPSAMTADSDLSPGRKWLLYVSVALASALFGFFAWLAWLALTPA